MKSKPLKLSEFIADLKDNATKRAKANNEELVLTPRLLQSLYEERYPNLPKKDSSAYRKALSRCGLNAEKRQELVKEQRLALAQLDVMEYPQVKDYIANAEIGHVQQSQIKEQLDCLRKLWIIMNKTDPNGWTLTDIIEAIKASGTFKEIINENNIKVWEHPAALKRLLGSFSTMWKGKLPNNWSANLCQHKAGELKDFTRFHELAEFRSHLTDTELLSREGWDSAFTLGVQMGCREGTNGNTGLLGLLWEDIDFSSRRCSLREKGHRGNSGERWEQVPLDMFKFLHSWESFIKYYEQQGKPTKGKVFPISYNALNEQFHKICRQCNNRFKDIDQNDCIRLHSWNRRTHGQYAQRCGIRLEFICGKAPNGRFGVGWKDPKIPVNYYLSEESEEIDAEELSFMRNHSEYQRVLATMEKTNREIKAMLGDFS